MPNLGAVLGQKRPLMDRSHRLFELWPAPLDPLMCAPVIAAGAKRRTLPRGKLRRASECRARLVDGLIDALVTQLHRRPVTEAPAQVTADLLRAPPLGRQLTDQLAQLEAGVDAPPMMTSAARGRAAMSLERAIATAIE